MQNHTRVKILEKSRSLAKPVDLSRIRRKLLQASNMPETPDYVKYIRSVAWRKKRETALNHYNHRCVLCSSKKKLQVHHLHYRTLGAERMEDLAICCQSCHFKLHLND